MIEKCEEPRSSAVKMKIRAKKQTAKEKNGGISRKIKDLRRDVAALLKQKFVKNVVQDLTSGGHEWMRAKWSAPIRKYWKISEQMMVKYCDLDIFGQMEFYETLWEGIQLMWCVLLILLPIALLFAESSMNNLQSVSIVAAFPIGAVIVMITTSFMKDAKKYMDSLEEEKIRNKK